MLMIPGPTEISQAALKQLSLPMKPHYGEPWSTMYFDVVAKTKKVFQTENDLFILAATSSAAMELAVSHAVEPGEKILVCNNGFFGDRFAEMADCFGLEVVMVRADYGEPITADQVRSALNDHHDARALAIVHNESSTAVESDLKGITAAAREKGVLTIVDCVSSMGGVDVPVDRLGIDYCISGSQKCLAAPAGLGFISVSKGAWQRLKKRKQPLHAWYLSLSILKKYQTQWVKWHPQGPNTAPVSLYLALDQALNEILKEGLPARFARHTRARDAFRAAMRAMGLKLFVKDAAASRTLTAFCLPDGIDGAQVREKILNKHKILLAGGLGTLASKVIRVSHMALTASEDHLIPTIEAIESELKVAGAAIKTGVAAATFKREFSRS